MLLRSSSTPGSIGSLISPSLSHSPNKDVEENANKLNSTILSCSSSPTSQETCGSSLRGLRRASSDGNLKGLAHSHSSCDIEDQIRYLCAQKKSSCLHSKTNKTMLRSAPSFEIYTSVDGVESEEVPLTRTVTIGDYIDGLGIGGGDFSFGSKKNMGLIEEEGEYEEERLNGIGEEIERPVSPPMYLATGLGISVPGFDDSGEFVDLTLPNFDDSTEAEDYYKRMIDESPCHPLLLRNYAQLLQKKGDLYGAEDYYHRATMADPGDGESWMQYAKLVWELHHDQHRALTYFERAALAAPQDSNILAAYACFLWEMEDDEEDDTAQEEHIQVLPIQIEKNDLNKLEDSISNKEIEPVSPSLHIAAGLRIDVRNFTAADANSSGDLEEYLKRMVEENPCNPLVLRNYAQFLYQSKGDLEGAEEYFSRAILADAGDGEIMSQYAKLVWELHHDRDKALCYFERAVEASPADSHVLAAYACFLWETEEDEDDSKSSDRFQQVAPIRQEAVTTANAYA